MKNHFTTKYMIDGEWQEAIDDNTTNICLYCSFYNNNSDLCSECCHANHAENECDECDNFIECFPKYDTE